MVIFSTFGTLGKFGTPVAFCILRIGSVFSTLGIIKSELWYICCTLVHLTFGTLVCTLHQLVHYDCYWLFLVRLVHIIYVWYTSCVWYSKDRISVYLVHCASFLVSFGIVVWHTLRLVHRLVHKVCW